MKPEQFTGRVSIDTYADFHQLLEKVYPLLPSFHFQEDFIPSPDWGSVKYHLEEEDFKIFYGTDIENQYDYLQLFEILFGSFNDEFLSLSGRSPNEEFYGSLILQDKLISSLVGQPEQEKLGDISQGYKEIPPENFWQEASNFYKNFVPQELLKESFLENYSQEIGQSRPELSSRELFESVLDGKPLPFMFLRCQDRFLLVLPRRISEVLLEDWSNVFAQHRNELFGTDKRYFTHLSGAVYKYLRFRINKKDLFGLTNAVDLKDHPHELLFSASILAKNQLIMIYVADPFTKSEEINQHLQDVAPKLIEAMTLISKTPVSLGLNLEQQIVKFQSKTSSEALAPMLVVVLPQATFHPLRIRMPVSLSGRFIFLDHFLGIFDELDNPDEFISFIEYFEEIRDRVDNPFTSMLDYYASYKDSHGVLISGARKPGFIMLDPHWGSEMRYESLSEFWSMYPDIGFFDYPRGWKPIRETDTRVRLVARGYFGSALYTEIGETKVFITAPYEDLTYEQGLVTDLLMQSLEDSA